MELVGLAMEREQTIADGVAVRRLVEYLPVE
jgi:hypothetical protein